MLWKTIGGKGGVRGGINDLGPPGIPENHSTKNRGVLLQPERSPLNLKSFKDHLKVTNPEWEVEGEIGLQKRRLHRERGEKGGDTRRGGPASLPSTKNKGVYGHPDTGAK